MSYKLTRGVEDYLEAIYHLCGSEGARTKDIASALGVKPPSVTEMVGRLCEMGYVTSERYGNVTLTPKGERLARKVIHRHKLLVEFLLVIGVSERTAQVDACKIEHDLSAQTVERLTTFVHRTMDQKGG